MRLPLSHSGVRRILGQGNGQPAFREAEGQHFFDLLLLFDEGILAQNANIGYPVLHVLRDIGIAQVQNIYRVVAGRGFQLVFTVVDPDTALFEQFQRSIQQAAGFLNGDFQTYV